MAWRTALVWGLLIETLIVSVLALYLFGVIPPAAFGGVRIHAVAVVLHLPSSLLALPVLGVITRLGLGVQLSLLVGAMFVGAFQVVFFAALVSGVVRHPKIGAAAGAAAVALVAIALVATTLKAPPYPEGMDANRDRRVSMEEWIGFHASQPRFYGGFDQSGYITRGSEDYYEREFKRVDCNHDSEMDAFEYGELHWNLRWCESPSRPPRPWWK